MSETITVEGMTCEGCEQNVEEALRGVAGVTDAEADRESDAATVEGEADEEKLVSAVQDAGYDARPRES